MLFTASLDEWDVAVLRAAKRVAILRWVGIYTPHVDVVVCGTRSLRSPLRKGHTICASATDRGPEETPDDGWERHELVLSPRGRCRRGWTPTLQGERLEVEWRGEQVQLRLLSRGRP